MAQSTSTRPTIDDVAEKSGFSKATVSAVLNDSDRVKESTREKILNIMDELNYRPRASARQGFKTSGTRSLGLIIKEIDNPYYAQIVAGARAFANERGYTILAGSSEGEYDAEQRIVNVLKSKDVDGLIIVPILDEHADLSYLFELKRRNFPFVLLEAVRGVPASVVDIDNVVASHRAVQYLIENGHSHIVHFSGPGYSTHSEERVEGVRRAYSESSLVFNSNVVVPAGASPKDGYEAAMEFFRNKKNGDLPTAATCYNDLVALGVMRALNELGIQVPEDVSVIGHDDIELLEYLPRPLTTVHVPRFEMGRKAAEMIIRNIEAEEKLAPERVDVKSKLVIRSTTRSLLKEA